ncbi:hypothetical protein L841_5520 [Mycobacterium sp. MAC_080597_8934]|uniref:hypothetical protein n=1 Tax=unclassified Mycobacterium avium complex (MAC) TaxID=2750822 RepID=UPI000449A729|nr:MULTISPECIES: hypothetical protein [unclassified Mycobacterium avium complex (MAC)]ETZ58038.1 hypothetical protein L841_5520 [Mycobacterium sp. MAC_080597_8934]ETZ67513.1 hypothetical protein L840_1670 [Mycobacterium sp. MAC_011194_8550]
MSDYPGGETVAVVQFQPTGATDSLFQPVKAPTVVAWVFGCAFEPYTRGPVEEQSDTITSHERAWAFLPYVAGFGIPTFDQSGNPLLDSNDDPIPVAIDNSMWIQPQRPNDALAQRNYKVQGLPEIEYDIDGSPSYAWIVCEWQAG